MDCRPVVARWLWQWLSGCSGGSWLCSQALMVRSQHDGISTMEKCGEYGRKGFQ